MAACPLVSPVDVLDDIQRLKAPMDGCLMRVFEGIEHRRREQKLYRNTGVPAGLLRTRQEEPDEGNGEDDDEGLTTRTRDRALSEEEICEFDYLTRDVVRVLDWFVSERSTTMSRLPSRPACSARRYPAQSGGMRLALPPSGYSTPYIHGSAHNSRPVTRAGSRERRILGECFDSLKGRHAVLQSSIPQLLPITSEMYIIPGPG